MSLSRVIGEELYIRRSRYFRSTERLAARLHVSRSTIWRIEAGRNDDVGIDMVWRFHRALQENGLHETFLSFIAECMAGAGIEEKVEHPRVRGLMDFDLAECINSETTSRSFRESNNLANEANELVPETQQEEVANGTGAEGYTDRKIRELHQELLR